VAAGTIITSFDTPGIDPRGLAFDGKYLWNSDNDDDKIYCLDLEGNVIASFDTPGAVKKGREFLG